jgi:ferredoxin
VLVLSPSTKGWSPPDTCRALRLALAQLHQAAPAPRDIVPLPAGAPFGAVEIDEAECTLYLACVGVCPTGGFEEHGANLRKDSSVRTQMIIPRRSLPLRCRGGQDRCSGAVRSLDVHTVNGLCLEWVSEGTHGVSNPGRETGDPEIVLGLREAGE